MTRVFRDHFGAPLSQGEHVEIFRVVNSSMGGDALGWREGIPGCVVQFGGPTGAEVLVELDGETRYAAPHDKAREWSRPYLIVRSVVSE
jgi:hypothetical protein